MEKIPCRLQAFMNAAMRELKRENFKQGIEI